MAILMAVEDCVEQARGDLKALRNAPVAPKKNESVEIDTQICIVGSGSAGTAAACEASLQGMSAIVIEQCANIGGNGLVSGGNMLWACAPEEMRVDMNDAYRSYFEGMMVKLTDMGTPQELIDTVQRQYDDYYAAGNTKLFDSVEMAGALQHGRRRHDAVRRSRVPGPREPR